MADRITVHAGFHERKSCPVSYDSGPSAGNVRLLDAETEQEVPTQSENGVVSWIVDRLSAWEAKDYLVTPAQNSSYPSSVDVTEKDTTVDISVGGEQVATYHFGTETVRPFLNPVIGAGDESVVRELFDSPSPPDHDHIHHRGILAAHGDVNGVDDWSEEEGHGFIRHRCFKEIVAGPVYGKIVAENSWVGANGAEVLTETRAMKFYNTADIRIIDFEITFLADSQPVNFGDTKEGGILSLRVATPMRSDRGGRIENAHGAVGEAETWGKRSPWCDYSGPLRAGTVGVTIMDHPDNLRHPTYWHVRDYGLMTANPFALSYYYNDKSRDGSFSLARGNSMVFRYRVFIHRGTAAEGGVADAYHNYINTPAVEDAEDD